MKSSIIVLLVTLIVCGCTQSQNFSFAGLDVIETQNRTQNVFIVDFNGHKRICLEPDADAISFSTTSTSVGIGPNSAGETLANGASDLGGRSPAVLITRELMFRACELTANIGADAEKTMEIYNIFLNIVVEISKTQTNNGTQAMVSQISVGKGGVQQGIKPETQEDSSGGQGDSSEGAHDAEGKGD